ncbi:MAG: hypothetical protein O2807_03110 [bacterium]|nr:hypothetical protein [bacterium]
MIRKLFLFISSVIALAAFSGMFPLPSVAGPAAAPGQEKRQLSPKEQKELVGKQQKIGEAQLKDVQLKIRNLHRLIQDVNDDLVLRTSSGGTYERKRALENQLRDIITLSALTAVAMDEARRLRQEIVEIRQGSRSGPLDPRRLQLVNFLEARRQEYVFFATR